MQERSCVERFMVTSVQKPKAELRRLVLARTDIESAGALLDLLARRPDVPGTRWEDIAWGLWTGVVVSYARPFKPSKLQLDAEWSRFEDQSLQDLHDQVVGPLRDKLFAHNDAMPHRDVRLLPPDEADEVQMTFTRMKVIGPKRLCHAQVERLTKRIQTLGSEITYGRNWPGGRPVLLSDISDKLLIVPVPSPFQAPRHRRGETPQG